MIVVAPRESKIDNPVRVLVAINPSSGGGKGKVVGEKVRRYLTQTLHSVSVVQESSRLKTLERLNFELNDTHFDVLVCVGGDGFVHDVLPICITYQLALMVIPAGTGNDFARTIGVHKMKYADLLDYLGKSAPSLINVGSIRHPGGESPFVQILSTGFDATVNERANNFRKIRGKVKYVIAVLIKVWKFKAIDFLVTIDEAEIVGKAMLVCVANGNSYGAGIKVIPFAKHDDGVLDVMILDEMNPIRLLLVFPKVFFGKHVGHPKLNFYSGKSVKIVGQTWAFADGEKISHLPVEVSLSTQDLLVYKS